MSKPLLFIGAGGHARVLIETALRQGREIVGCTSLKHRPGEEILSGVKALGNDDVLAEYAPEEVELVNAVGSVRHPEWRGLLFERFSARGFHFATLVHDNAFLSESAVTGHGALVMNGAIVQTGAQLEENVLINTRSVVEHDCRIGAHSHIASGALLAGGTRVGARCHIGAGAVVLQELAIGADSVIGAGAIVIRDVPAGATMVGNPARALDHSGQGHA